MFLGPTGVGKTYLAQKLAEVHLSDFLFTRYNNRKPALRLLLEYNLADGQQQDELHPTFRFIPRRH